MTSVKQLVQAPAQEGGPRHRHDCAETNNRHCNDFADHSLTNSDVTKARQANVARRRKGVRQRRGIFNRSASIKSNKVTVLQISVVLLTVTA
jgi:hypothetical protein